MPFPLTLELMVASSDHAAAVSCRQSRSARGILKRVWNVYYLQQPGTSSRFRTYLCRVEVSNGNAGARLPVRGPHDAQESGFYHCGGAVPDARDRSHDRDIHGGERRTPSPVAVLASRAAYPRLHRVSDVSERRSAPILDFRTGISGSAPRYPFLGVIGRMDHRRCESCWEDAAGARYGGIPERRTAGNSCGGPGRRAVDIANRRCTWSAGGGRYFLWHVAKRFCR